MKVYPHRAFIWETAGLFSILIVEIALMYNRCLYGHAVDESGMTMLDGGYRIFLGQVPFRDFHTPLGIPLFYFQAAFFHIFGGFSMKAVALQSAVMGAVGTFLIFLILRVYLGSLISLFFAGVAALTFSLPRPIPLWDELANTSYLAALTSFSLAYRYRHKLTSVTITCLAALSGLAFTAAIFTKYSTGLMALAFIAPLWLFIPFGKEDTMINRAKSFGICLFITLFSSLLLVVYFASQGDFFTDISHTASMTDRLLILLPHNTLKRFLSKDFGKIFFIVYISLVALSAGFSYFLKLNIKQFLKDYGGLVATFVSLAALTYLAEMASRSAGLTSLGLFSLLLGLLYAILSKIKDSHYYTGIEQRRFSNFCLITGVAFVITFLLWGLTYQNNYPGRTKPADIQFLTAMLIIAVALLALWVLNRKPKGIYSSPAKNIFIWSKIYVALLSLSVILYFEYDYNVVRSAMARLLMPLLKKTDIVQYVEFKDIPALNGVYADRKKVKSIEEFVSWFRPKLDEDPSLRNGSGIYIFPTGQSLYGILGVESFRNAHIFLEYKYTFSQPDPDTDEILRKSPKFIVIHIAYKRADTLTDTFKELPHPKLKKILKKDYVLAARFDNFLVFQKVDYGFK